MLDSILNAAKGYVEDAVTNHPSVPSHQNASVSDAIVGALKNHLGGQTSGSGFDISQLGNLLSGSGGGSLLNAAGNLLGSGNSNTSSLQNSVVDAVVKKTGLNPQIAQSVASAVLPGVVSALTKKFAWK
jgi:hypothetical protein